MFTKIQMHQWVILGFLCLIEIQNASSQTIALMAGAIAEDAKECHLAFVDLETKSILFEVECPEYAGLSTALYEYNGSILFSADQNPALSHKWGSVIATFSPFSMDFDRVETYPTNLWINKFYKQTGTAYVYDFDDKKYLELDLQNKKWELQSTLQPEDEIQKMYFLKNGKVLVNQKSEISVLPSFDPLKRLNVQETDSENVILPDISVTNIVDTDEFENQLAVECYSNGLTNLSIISANNYEMIASIDIHSNIFLGWGNKDHVLFLTFLKDFNSDNSLDQLGHYELNSMDIHTQQITSTKELKIQHIIGISSRLLSENKRYVLIGIRHEGGMKTISSGWLVIYDREKDTLTELEFKSGDVSQIIELSEATSKLIHENDSTMAGW